MILAPGLSSYISQKDGFWLATLVKLSDRHYWDNDKVFFELTWANYFEKLNSTYVSSLIPGVPKNVPDFGV